MKYILLIVGMILALLGFNFLMKYWKIRKTTVKAVGRVVDNRKVDATKNMPAGYLAIADYQVQGKTIRGIATFPMAQKYSLGYQIELLWNKSNPKNFTPVAFIRAMQIYCLLLPIGLALAVWGITLFF